MSPIPKASTSRRSSCSARLTSTPKLGVTYSGTSRQINFFATLVSPLFTQHLSDIPCSGPKTAGRRHGICNEVRRLITDEARCAAPLLHKARASVAVGGLCTSHRRKLLDLLQA